MNLPKTSSVVVMVIAAVLCGSVYAARSVFPPLRVVHTPKLALLRSEEAQLAPFTETAAAAADAQLAELRRNLWTAETFDLWRKNNLPAGWTLQELGAAELKHVHGRRYAFQRPGATDQNWPEILSVLTSLEQARATSVQSVALAVLPGYAASRRFSQCLLVAVFYFGGADDSGLAPAATAPKTMKP